MLRSKLLYNDHGSDWLHIIPSRQLGTLLSSSELRLLLRFRLGIPLCSASRLCNCCDKQLTTVEELAGDHSICCVKAGYVKRHYLMCNEIQYLLSTSGLIARPEQYVDHQHSLRVDLAVQAFDAEGPLALDVQVLYALSHRLGDCAVADAERKKIEKYRGACALINMSFHPIVMDTLGNFGPVSLKMVQKIISKAAERSDSPPEAGLYYWQRLSLALARAVARQLVLSMQ